MLHLLLLVAIALAGFSLPAAADQLTFGVSAESTYDTNLFADPEDGTVVRGETRLRDGSIVQPEVRREPEDDVSLVLTPGFRLEGQGGDFSWKSHYSPNIETFASLDIPTRWEHVVGGEVEWQLGARTLLTASEEFKYLQSISQEGVEGDQVVASNFTQQLVKVNRLAIGLRRILSPTRALRFDLANLWLDQQYASKSNYLRGGARYDWTPSAWDTLGVGGSISQQDIQRQQSELPDQKTAYFNVSGSWRHEFDPSLSLELSAGPAFVSRDNAEITELTAISGVPYPLISRGNDFFLIDGNSCSQFSSSECATLGGPLEDSDSLLLRAAQTTIPPEGSGVDVQDQNVTLFASFSLNKRWDLFRAGLSFTRQDSPNSGFGTSTISDSLYSNFSWNPARRWTLGLQAGVSRYTQATEGARLGIGVAPLNCALPNLDGNCDVTLDIPTAGGIVQQPSELPPGAGQTTNLRYATVDSSSAVVNTSVRMLAEYQLTERTRLFGRLTYFDQRAIEEAEATNDDYDRFLAVIGVSYEFLPLKVF